MAPGFKPWLHLAIAITIQCLFFRSLVEAYSITWFIDSIDEHGDLVQEETTSYIPLGPQECWNVPFRRTEDFSGNVALWTPVGFSLTASLNPDRFPYQGSSLRGYPPRALALYDRPGCWSSTGSPIAIVRLWDETGTQNLDSFEDLFPPSLDNYHRRIYSLGICSFRELGEGLSVISEDIWNRVVVGEGLMPGDVFQLETIFGNEVVGTIFEDQVTPPVGSDILEEIPEEEILPYVFDENGLPVVDYEDSTAYSGEPENSQQLPTAEFLTDAVYGQFNHMLDHNTYEERSFGDIMDSNFEDVRNSRVPPMDEEEFYEENDSMGLHFPKKSLG
ncbi:hypothetical protein TWF694_007255 [Orbilia ellipsospora]|uniref:Uncharacterized protein n=1 Tax=Orbilia ellipsospora TaxID=2528407 RepID=A0AAV9XHQ1_9PEZI